MTKSLWGLQVNNIAIEKIEWRSGYESYITWEAFVLPDQLNA